MTEKEKMIAGQLYFANDPELLRERNEAKLMAYRLNVSEYDFNKGERYRNVLNELLPNCPSDLFIEPPFWCDYGYNIFCEEKVYFNHNCLILDVCEVHIGANSMFGPGVQIYTATHPIDADERRTGLESGKPITIGRDCWIGGAAIICPGVTIGDRCVIGAGSVVTKDVPSDCIAVGNPAVVKKKLA